MQRSSFKIGLGLFAVVVLMSVGGTPSLSADKPITIGLIMEARPEVEPWSLAWHDAAEAMKKKDPSIKVIESDEAYELGAGGAGRPADARCGSQRAAALHVRAH